MKKVIAMVAGLWIVVHCVAEPIPQQRYVDINIINMAIDKYFNITNERTRNSLACQAWVLWYNQGYIHDDIDNLDYTEVLKIVCDLWKPGDTEHYQNCLNVLIRCKEDDEYVLLWACLAGFINGYMTSHR